MGEATKALMNITQDMFNLLAGKFFEILAMQPATFNPSAWATISAINTIFVSVGCTLVVLFFLISFCQNSIDVKDDMRFEMIFKSFIRVSIAEFFVVNSLTITTSIMQFGINLSNVVSGGSSTGGLMDLTPIMTAIDDASFISCFILCLPAFLLTIVAAVCGGILVFQAYSRLVKILLIIPYGALAYSTIGGGSHVLGNILPGYVKFLLSAVLEALSMVVAWKICVSIFGGQFGVLGEANSSWVAVGKAAWGMFSCMLTIVLCTGITLASKTVASKALSLGG